MYKHRKAFAGIVAAAASIVIAGGTAAQADSPAPAQTSAARSQHTGTSGDAHTMGPAYYDWYWSIFSCTTAGKSLQRNGYIKSYMCVPVPSGPITYLYVWR